MVERQTWQAIGALARAVLSIGPLVRGVAVPVRVVPVAGDDADQPDDWPAARWEALDRLLHRVARECGVAGLRLARGIAPDELDVFERVVSGRLDLAAPALPAVALPPVLLPQVDRIAAAAVAESLDVVFRREVIAAADGVPLTVYGGGPSRAPTVVIPACGMPAVLAEPWLRHLGRDRRVLTWESRGMFAVTDHPGDPAADAATQARDLCTVLDHYGVGRAHVIGLCSGAVIGLVAAATYPDRVASLSLWHGAYAFASGTPRTRFQHDLIELMALAAHSPATAASVQQAFCRIALTNTPAEVAHFVLYPYTNAELFYRYCRLNLALATVDVEPYLARVDQPTLVVTGPDDQTAHPQGSRQVAQALPHARLWLAPHRDHAALFQADDSLIQVAVDFADALSSFPVTARHACRSIASQAG